MRTPKNRSIKLWLIAVSIALIMAITVGVHPDLLADAEETYKELKIFSDVIELIEQNYVDPVATKELIQNAIQGMVQSLDPHSALLPPDAFEELQMDTQGKFTGIGVSITMKDGLVTVIAPIDGTPAFKAGILAGDKIIKVDGEPIKDLQEAVKKMRGPKGTTVVVSIKREEVEKLMDFTLVRDVIPIESVKAILLKPGYGYVRITNFSDHTTKDLESALDELEPGDTPLSGLVLDLRGNPGGLLPQAIQVSDLFLDTGTILSIKGRVERHTKIYKAHPDTVKRDYPIVVLINGGSASASEIVAGALQDNKRALILGTNSFGKGSVQTVETLRNGFGIKLTIARYYTPSGRSIQAKGIEPDIVVKYKFLDPSETSETESRMIKEKDLKNHLEAEPAKNAEKEKTKKKLQINDEESKFRKLKLETLKSDNQVMRALEILIGHELFKGTHT